MTKKIITLFMVLILLVSCISCDKSDENSSPEEQSEQVSDFSADESSEEEESSASPEIVLEKPTLDEFPAEGMLIIRKSKYNVVYYCKGAEKFDLKIVKTDKQTGDEISVIFEGKDLESKKYTVENIEDGDCFKVTLQAKNKDGVSPVVEGYFCCDYNLISEDEIASAAKKYNIAEGSTAYQALLDINSYNDDLALYSGGLLIFEFEGCGIDFSKRFGAMFVVVDHHKITYLSQKCSTVPDYPFDPKKNEDTDMPTIIDGIYSFTSTNHNSSNGYASLNITVPKVLRFKNQNKYYTSTSVGIDIHRRDCDGITSQSAGWVNSAGCQLVGGANTSEYLNFVKTVGLLSKTSTSLTPYTYEITGKVIVSRKYAHDYLSNLGYPEEAIKIIRGENK